uniref:C1q domain-containing protein n=1 Tax=Pundamilia nyererei TaxID=303518 RepID=A0A3B4GMA5_9CICH
MKSTLKHHKLNLIVFFFVPLTCSNKLKLRIVGFSLNKISTHLCLLCLQARREKWGKRECKVQQVSLAQREIEDLKVGDQGSMGPPGASGPQGESGICPATCESVPGAPGTQGPPGPAGARGLPGCTNGTNGADGKPGQKGDKGDKGDIGSQGIQGTMGLKGNQGDMGLMGPPGPCSPAIQSAFSACINESFPAHNFPIPFPHILTNQQNHLNRNGIYTAPVNGTYVFSFHVSVAVKPLKVGLFRNFYPVAKITEGTIPSTTSHTVVLNLYMGDQVWLQVKDPTTNGMYTDTESTSTFSGYLLHPDSCEFPLGRNHYFPQPHHGRYTWDGPDPTTTPPN